MAAVPVPPLPPPPPGVPPPGLLPPPLGMPMHRPLPPAPPRQSSLPPSNVVLLTGIPKQLHQALSSWILPCGPARTILWYPKQFEKDETMDASKKSMALVTMMHGDGAWKLVHTLTALKSDLGDLVAHMVPASPDIPLPPIILDESIAKPLQQHMRNSFHAIQAGTFEVTPVPTLEQQQLQQQQPLLDSYKVAAAAGGHNYDEDADPLNAPAVLQAVREFRASLYKTSAVQQARRITFVQERLEKAMKALLQPPPAAVATVGTGVPPLGGLVPPPPPPPPPPGFDSGKRGQSNLPAWMTTEPSLPPPQVPFLNAMDTTTANQQNNSEHQQSDNEPLMKKPKLSVPIDETLLRAHVAQQITHYMGEEETTLIDFCVQHVMTLMGSSSSSSLQEAQTTMTTQNTATWEGLTSELQPVLEEDTRAFVEALQRKVKELSGE